MTRLNDGSEARAIESPEESMRFYAVEVAWQLLWEHPNWLRGYGFTIDATRWKEFDASFDELVDEVRRIVEWEMFSVRGLPTDTVRPDYFEALSIGAVLLLTNQRPVRPLPPLVGRTIEALARFHARENGLGPLDPVEECDGVDAGEWSVDDEMVEESRLVH
jgi:hypothetical protein